MVIYLIIGSNWGLGGVSWNNDSVFDKYRWW